MPNTKQPTSSKNQPSLSIADLIARNNGADVDELTTDGQTLFGLLTLIIDIKYRVRYGASIGERAAERYSEAIVKDVVADQITPVDDGLLRH